MAKLSIQTGAGNEILRAKSPVVKLEGRKPSKKLAKLLADMKETMIKSDGVGLAAPQVGQNIRAIVCLFNQGTKNELAAEMINPMITRFSEKMELGEEGCLSLPGEFGMVARHAEVTVRYIDLKGEERVLQLKGLNAVIVQHEIDHLDGTLFTDRITEQAIRGTHVL